MVPGTLSFGKKLLPLFQLFRKLGLCLGEEKPLCSTSSYPGEALCVVFLRRLFPPVEAGGRLPPETLQSTGGFPWVLLFGPGRCAGELGSSGLERGESTAGASLREHGQRSLCRPPPAQPALPASRNSFPLPTTAGTPTKWGAIHSRSRNRKAVGRKRELPGLLSVRQICLLSSTGRFLPRTRQQQLSSILRGPPQALPRCGHGSECRGRRKMRRACRTLARGCSQSLG